MAGAGAGWYSVSMRGDQRQFYRVLIRAPIRCLATGPDGLARLLMVETVDLSAGGASATCDHRLEPGGPLVLAMSLDPGEQPLRLPAEVAWADAEPGADGAYRIGLRFCDPRAADEQRLMAAVFAQERLHAGRHTRVRCSLWHPVGLEVGGELRGGHAEAISSDDVQVVTHARLVAGDHVRVRLDYAPAAIELDAETTVLDASRDGTGTTRATLVFDAADRLARSNVLRLLIEEERRTATGEG